MGIELNGKLCSDELYTLLGRDVDALKKQIGHSPSLAIIQIGQDSASQIYVKSKKKACKKLGINCYVFSRPYDVRETDVLDLINKLNSNPMVNGIMVQLPIPEHLDKTKILNAIDPKKDVDGLSNYNIGGLSNDSAYFYPCTPLGVIKLMDYYNVDYRNKKVTVIGRSDIVGRPLATILSNRDYNCTVTLLHSKSQNAKVDTDVLITAVGDVNLNIDNIKNYNVVIDCGINRVDGKIYGDVSEELKKRVKYYSPVPKGVGLMTVYSLMENVIKAYKNQNKDGINR